MTKTAMPTDWTYYGAGIAYLVGWGIFSTFLPENVSWLSTLPLFLYSSGVMALALYLLRWFNRKVNRLSMYDPDMGVYSERFFFNALNMEYSRSNRDELPLSLIVFSFDTLKETAEQLNKSVEEMQKMFIEKISETIRSTDIFSTLEDDKFTILLPSTDVDGAKVAANRLRSAITAELQKERLGQRTSMPFGICGTSPEVKTSQELLAGSIKAYDTAVDSPRNKIVACNDRVK